MLRLRVPYVVLVCSLVALTPGWAHAAPCDEDDTHHGHGWHYGNEQCDADDNEARARKDPGSRRAQQAPAQVVDGVVSTAVTPSTSLAQVGDTVTWTISITNETSADLADVVVVDAVPTEFAVLEAATSETTPATIERGFVTWTIPSLPVGAATVLTWDGRVDSLGDLEALNSVTVSAPSLESTVTDASVFLGGSVDVLVRQSAQKPDWGTEQRTVKLNFNRPPSSVAGGAADADAAPGLLPMTGAAVDGWIVLAGLLMLTGAVLLVRRRSMRTAATCLLIALVLAACTSDPEDTTQARPEASESPGDSEDRVLGKRIERNDAGEGDGRNELPETELPSDEVAEAPSEGTDTSDDPGPSADVVAQQPAPQPSTTVVEVPADPPAPVPLAATPGDNTMTFEWDEPSRSVLSAASSRVLRAGAPTELLTALTDPQDHLGARVDLTNITDDRRLHVAGHLVLEVAGAGGTTSFTSDAIDQVLDPGDSVAADFEFLLPSGSYSITARFVPN
ncbi:MAG TPA: LPXTG cell wall anchor domain-containing protein [Actinomycetota bacterium]|nr:LPXTG cell wall anchor domain-containing protein [Actinomycetota bacterium]